MMQTREKPFPMGGGSGHPTEQEMRKSPRGGDELVFWGEGRHLSRGEI